MASKVKTQLLQAVKLRQKKYEKEEGFVKRVLRKVNELPDEEWANLSDRTQIWVNEAVVALNTRNEVLPFPEDGDGKPKEKEDLPVEEEPVKEERPPIAEKLIKKFKAPIGAGKLFDQLTIQNPDKNWLEILEMVEKTGLRFSHNSATVHFYETWRFMRQLDELGYLKEPWPENLPVPPGEKLIQQNLVKAKE